MQSFHVWDHCDNWKCLYSLRPYLFELYDVRMLEAAVVHNFPLNILCDLHMVKK